jgi:hypothetical protein
MHTDTAQVGDIIRSYDFKPMADRGDSYIEGQVIAKGMTPNGFEGYTVQLTNRVAGGEKVEYFDDPMYTPFEVMFMEYEQRIMKMEG